MFKKILNSNVNLILFEKVLLIKSSLTICILISFVNYLQHHSLPTYDAKHFNFPSQLPPRSLWSHKIEKLAWMVWHSFPVLLMAIPHRQCSGQKKAQALWCFRTTRMAIYMSRSREHCKLMVYKKMMPDTMCAQPSVWSIQQQYEHFCR